MEVKVNVVLVKGTNVEVFPIKVKDEDHAELVKKKLIAEQKKIINLLEDMKKAGLIKSIRKPVNKKIQSNINNLVKSKKLIKKTIDILKSMY